MRTSRRILRSFACVVFAIALLFLWWSLVGLLYSRSLRLGQLHDLAQMLLVYFLFALPGWLIALPFVVLLKDAQGWRGWFTLIVGTCIGPGFLLIWSLIASPGQFSWRALPPGLGFPLIISLPTTVSYVLALKFAHRRSMAPEP
jgi:hypothetical protein